MCKTQTNKDKEITCYIYLSFSFVLLLLLLIFEAHTWVYTRNRIGHPGRLTILMTEGVYNSAGTIQWMGF